MIEDRMVPTGETRESMRASAEQRALAIINDMNLRTKDIGGLNRNKVMATVLTEAMIATYLEGRSSAMIDTALREAQMARENELQSAKNLLAKESVAMKEAAVTAIGQSLANSANAFGTGLIAPVMKNAKKAIWWIVGVAVVNAAVVAALVALLLRK